MNKLFICILALTSFNSVASAQEVWGQGGGSSYSMPAIEVGFRSGSAKVGAAQSNKQEVGYQLGASLVFNVSEKFGVKTGLMYTERNFKSTINNIELEGKLSYFDIPVLLMYKIEDYAGIYLGFVNAIRTSEEVKFSNGSQFATGYYESNLFPIMIGAQFKFSPNLGTNIYFEKSSSDVAENIGSYQAVGASLLIMLD